MVLNYGTVTGYTDESAASQLLLNDPVSLAVNLALLNCTTGVGLIVQHALLDGLPGDVPEL